jgi:hypothetical protein
MNTVQFDIYVLGPSEFWQLFKASFTNVCTEQAVIGPKLFRYHLIVNYGTLNSALSSAKMQM